MTDKKTEHLQFIRDTKWEEYVSDPVVSEALDKIEHRVKELKSSGSGSDSENPNAIRVKLVVVGDGAVGKTSLLIRFSTGQFPTEYLPTVFENYTTQMKSEHGPVLLHLWDTAGQEEYDRLRPLSYPRSDVILLCFSLISQVSFESLKTKWWPEVHHYIPNIPYILVGTKADLRDINSPDPNTGKVNLVTKEQATTLAQEIGCVKFMEVSSKEGRGVNEVFNEAINQVLLHRGVSTKGSSDGHHSSSSSSSSNTGGKKPKKEKGCLLL